MATNSSNFTDSQANQHDVLGYGVAMSLILLVGFVGNILSLLVLGHPEHRRKPVSYLMMNLAVADIFIIVFGYPIIVSANLSDGNFLHENHALCNWSAFANGTVGIASIGTLTLMSLIICRGITKEYLLPDRLSKGKCAALVTSTWIYGALTNSPPLFGWNKFVPGTAGISCAPDWASNSRDDVSYIILLVLAGFVFPLAVICFCYFKIYRFVNQPSIITDNTLIQAIRRRTQLKVTLMTTMATLVFVLSWTPYCIVSLVATLKGGHVLTAGEAEIPELLAKASVVYNPFVYTAMNGSFRATLKKMFHLTGAPSRLSTTVSQVDQVEDEHRRASVMVRSLR